MMSPMKPAGICMKDAVVTTNQKRGKFASFLMYVKTHPAMYLMLVPGLFFLVLYKFWPLYGLAMAFQDYNIFAGKNPMDAIRVSEWVGWKWFEKLFASAQFRTVLINTLSINFLKILWLFPLPIIVSIMLNEIASPRYKKVLTTAVYIPYFFSWVIIYGIFYTLLGSSGLVNSLISYLGGTNIRFFTDTRFFRSLLVFTEGWKETGYNTIIYLAAITAIDPTLYEAARIDGASKWQQIWYVTIPGMLPTIVLMLILKIGYILTTGFEQIIIFYNPAVYDVADVIQTYVYRLGMGQANFSLATALGLFNSIVAFILVVGSNSLSKKTLGRSIW
jgi:putative aldouronate transport system permease protein